MSKQSRKGNVKDIFFAEIKPLVGLEREISQFITLYKQKMNRFGITENHTKIMLSAEG